MLNLSAATTPSPALLREVQSTFPGARGVRKGADRLYFFARNGNRLMRTAFGHFDEGGYRYYWVDPEAELVPDRQPLVSLADLQRQAEPDDSDFAPFTVGPMFASSYGNPPPATSLVRPAMPIQRGP